MKFWTKLFGEGKPEADSIREELNSLELKSRELGEAEHQRDSLLMWMKAGEATSQDRELLAKLEDRISILKKEIGIAEEQETEEEEAVAVE